METKHELIVIENAFNKEKEEAEKILKDKDKLENILTKLEQNLKDMPAIGDTLSNIPVMVLLVRSYIKQEYTEIPLKSIIAIVAVLLYVVNPFDIIPDVLPGVGRLDDAAVVGFALTAIKKDLDLYKQWREENKLGIN